MPSEARERDAGAAAVASALGRFAVPDVLHYTPGLPKTRSGKIMQWILRKIAVNKADALGDTSTLADPSVMDALIENMRASRKSG